MSRVFAAAIVSVPPFTTPELASIVPVASSASVPALIVVAPVYVFAPPRVKVPVPAVTIPPVPLITPV